MIFQRYDNWATPWLQRLRNPVKAKIFQDRNISAEKKYSTPIAASVQTRRRKKKGKNEPRQPRNRSWNREPDTQVSDLIPSRGQTARSTRYQNITRSSQRWRPTKTIRSRSKGCIFNVQHLWRNRVLLLTFKSSRLCKILLFRSSRVKAVSYTHLTLPTIYSV